MSYGPPQGLEAPKNRHAWPKLTPPRQSVRGVGIRCPDCGITQYPFGWTDRTGEWHTGPIPRCGESTWGRP